jgi:hypothetical protein
MVRVVARFPGLFLLRQGFLLRRATQDESEDRRPGLGSVGPSGLAEGTASIASFRILSILLILSKNLLVLSRILVRSGWGWC